MNIIKSKAEIMTDIDTDYVNKLIETAGRTCYKSENNITSDSADRFVRGLIKRGHEAMLEHFSFTVKFTTDRGITHEIVRHRVASFAQESTRFCAYNKDKFGNEITVIDPEEAMLLWVGKTVKIPNGKELEVTADTVYSWMCMWHDALRNAEITYMDMVNAGCPAELARGVLPTSLKAELIVTMNLREWRHFFNLRTVGTTGLPHPQISEITEPLLCECAKLLPAVFGDLWNKVKGRLRFEEKCNAEVNKDVD